MNTVGNELNEIKLTEENVLYIRSNPDNLNQREMATLFNVSYSNINAVVKRRSWKHI